MKTSTDYLNERNDEVGVTIRALAHVISQTVPEAAQQYKRGKVHFYINQQPFCYLDAKADHVELGFANSQPVKVTNLNKSVLPGLIASIYAAVEDAKQ